MGEAKTGASLQPCTVTPPVNVAGVEDGAPSWVEKADADWTRAAGIEGTKCARQRLEAWNGHLDQLMLRGKLSHSSCET